MFLFRVSGLLGSSEPFTEEMPVGLERLDGCRNAAQHRVGKSIVQQEALREAGRKAGGEG